MKKAHIVLIDDDDEFRTSLDFFMNTMADLQCHAFASLQAALEHLELHVPDVVVMDVRLLRAEPEWSLERIVRNRTAVPVLVCTHERERDTVFRALQAGASGYLLKEHPIGGLITAIREAIDGGAPLSPAISRQVVHSFWSARPGVLLGLSEREQQVLDLLAAGMRAKQIGSRLFLSAHTVRTHISSIYGKLHVHNRVEAVNKARCLRH